ncbi:MAG: hypothetical protein CMJ33_01935 [Phycisphaerae bacterium]|nr:hypothetical protein [Phycisphaerae bacterium]
MDPRPKHLDLQRERGLAIRWDDGRESFYSLPLLRKLSPSAEQRLLREEMEQNPLTVLPANRPTADGLSAVDAELVGNYAIRIKFSDGHETGIFTWHYLRRIDPDARNRRRTALPDARPSRKDRNGENGRTSPQTDRSDTASATHLFRDSGRSRKPEQHHRTCGQRDLRALA